MAGHGMLMAGMDGWMDGMAWHGRSDGWPRMDGWHGWMAWLDGWPGWMDGMHGMHGMACMHAMDAWHGMAWMHGWMDGMRCDKSALDRLD